MDAWCCGTAAKNPCRALNPFVRGLRATSKKKDRLLVALRHFALVNGHFHKQKNAKG